MSFEKPLDSLYRTAGKFGLFSTWAERAAKEQATAAAYRDHPGYQHMLDVLDGEVRRRFAALLKGDKPTEPLLTEMRTIYGMIRTLEGASTAQARAEEMQKYVERQTGLMGVDALRHRETLERAKAGARLPITPLGPRANAR